MRLTDKDRLFFQTLIGAWFLGSFVYDAYLGNYWYAAGYFVAAVTTIYFAWQIWARLKRQKGGD